MNSIDKTKASLSKKAAKKIKKLFIKFILNTIKMIENTIATVLVSNLAAFKSGCLSILINALIILIIAKQILKAPQMIHSVSVDISTIRNTIPSAIITKQAIKLCTFLNLAAIFKVKNSITPIAPIAIVIKPTSILLMGLPKI